MPTYRASRKWSNRGKKPTVYYEIHESGPRGAQGKPVLRTPLRVGVMHHEDDAVLAAKVAAFLTCDSEAGGDGEAEEAAYDAHLAEQERRHDEQLDAAEREAAEAYDAHSGSPRSRMERSRMEEELEEDYFTNRPGEAR